MDSVIILSIFYTINAHTMIHRSRMSDDEEELFSDSQFDPDTFFSHVDSLLDADNTGATPPPFIDLTGDREQSTSSYIRNMESLEEVTQELHVGYSAVV